jgi:hypothetical protein
MPKVGIPVIDEYLRAAEVVDMRFDEVLQDSVVVNTDYADRSGGFHVDIYSAGLRRLVAILFNEYDFHDVVLETVLRGVTSFQVRVNLLMARHGSVDEPLSSVHFKRTLREDFDVIAVEQTVLFRRFKDEIDNLVSKIRVRISRNAPASQLRFRHE